MPLSAEDFCQQAIAYLKVEAPASDVIEQQLSHADSPVLRPYLDNLFVAYLVDEGQSFAYVQHRHLAQAGISAEALHLIGMRNLAALAEERAEVRAHGELFALLMDGHFEASLLLFDEFWSQWYAELLPNGAVAALPARDVLAFSDAGNAEGIAQLRQLCERLQGQANHSLTSTLYRRHNNTWETLDETADL